MDADAIAQLQGLPKHHSDNGHRSCTCRTSRKIRTARRRAVADDQQKLIKQSVARCAWVSYNDPLGKKATVEQEIALHDKLVVSQPVRAGYDEQTEVLSENGWVRFADLAQSIRIAAVDPRTAQFTFEKPKLHTYDRDGTMLHASGRSIDLLVTPNHRMLIQTRTSRRVAGRHEYIYSPQKMVDAKDLPGKQDRYMSSVRYVGGSKGTYWEGALDGFIIGDGYRQFGRIGFHLSKMRKIEFIKTVLSHLKIDYTVTRDKHHRNQNTVFIQAKREGRNPPIASEKRLPNLRDKSAEYLNGLFDGLMNSDGGKHHEHGYTYSTTSAGLANDMTVLAAMVGREVRRARTHQIRGNRKPCWRFNITEAESFKTVRKKATPVEYIGKVYCATVSTGMLLVRRNGLQVVCGNSPAEHQVPRMNSSRKSMTACRLSSPNRLMSAGSAGNQTRTICSRPLPRTSW